MARPKSEEKRIALLESAAHVLAEHGIAAAPTSQIAKRAGVAEGTLFRYFENKDVLFNALYFHIKNGMCEELNKRYIPTDDFERRFRSLWNAYIDWGLHNPVQNKAVNQLSVSSVITEETKQKSFELFPDTDVVDGFANNSVFAGNVEFANTVFTAVADATMEYASRCPDEGESCKRMGFAALWKICETT